ncbi:hypothetical protein [Massilia genomosp. 1]|uniref:hypothetical protein n=1 Tax=Massilia genomosp. 1 TaxID=2609280 RepID=UPI001C9E4696|nr:hypothetical protein [Massilia genomosp. 1]
MLATGHLPMMPICHRERAHPRSGFIMASSKASAILLSPGVFTMQRIVLAFSVVIFYCAMHQNKNMVQS